MADLKAVKKVPPRDAGPRGVVELLDSANRAGVCLALFQWIESARHVLYELEYARENRPELDALLRSLEIGPPVDFDSKVSEGVQHLMGYCESLLGQGVKGVEAGA